MTRENMINHGTVPDLLDVELLGAGCLGRDFDPGMSANTVSFLIPCLMVMPTMTVESREMRFRTHGESEILDITDKTQAIVNSSKLKNGVVTLFVPGSTAALTTIEYEPGLLIDLPQALERLAPKDANYEHETRWHDGNGHSHIRASIIGPDLTVPFLEKRLTLGTWQQIIFIELDTRPRDRTVIVQLIGD